MFLGKKQFDENNHDEEIQSAEESFRVNYFLVVVDMAIASLKDIFEQLNIFENIFGFLFDSKKLKSLGVDANLRLLFLIIICRMLMQMTFFLT